MTLEHIGLALTFVAWTAALTALVIVARRDTKFRAEYLARRRDALDEATVTDLLAQLQARHELVAVMLCRRRKAVPKGEAAFETRWYCGGVAHDKAGWIMHAMEPKFQDSIRGQVALAVWSMYLAETLLACDEREVK